MTVSSARGALIVRRKLHTGKWWGQALSATPDRMTQANATPAMTAELDLPVPGMNCAACAGRIERALSALPGISDLAVNPATRRARMQVEGTPLERITAALSDAG